MTLDGVGVADMYASHSPIHSRPESVLARPSCVSIDLERTSCQPVRLGTPSRPKGSFTVVRATQIVKCTVVVPEEVSQRTAHHLASRLSPRARGNSYKQAKKSIHEADWTDSMAVVSPLASRRRPIPSSSFRRVLYPVRPPTRRLRPTDWRSTSRPLAAGRWPLEHQQHVGQCSILSIESRYPGDPTFDSIAALTDRPTDPSSDTQATYPRRVRIGLDSSRQSDMVNDNPSNWRQHGYPQPGYTLSGQYQVQPPRPTAPSTPQSPQAPAPSAGGQPTGYDPFVNWRNAISQAQQNAAVAAGYPQPQPTSSSAREAPQNQQSYAYWHASTVPPPRQAQPTSTPYMAAAQQSSAPIGQPPFYPGPWPPASRAAGMMAVSRSDSDSRRVVHLTQGGSLTGYGVPQGGPGQGGAGAGSGAAGQAGSGGGYAAGTGTGTGQAQGGSGAAGHHNRRGWRS